MNACIQYIFTSFKMCGTLSYQNILYHRGLASPFVMILHGSWCDHFVLANHEIVNTCDNKQYYKSDLMLISCQLSVVVSCQFIILFTFDASYSSRNNYMYVRIYFIHYCCCVFTCDHVFCSDIYVLSKNAYW